MAGPQTGTVLAIYRAEYNQEHPQFCAQAITITRGDDQIGFVDHLLDAGKIVRKAANARADENPGNFRCGKIGLGAIGDGQPCMVVDTVFEKNAGHRFATLEIYSGVVKPSPASRKKIP